MIASLPMYNRPELAAAHGRLWAEIMAKLLEAGQIAEPVPLSDDYGLNHWRDPQLLLSQTCGMPYRQALHGVSHLVASPIHRLGDEDGYYHSVLVAQAQDTRDSFPEFAGAHLACNSDISQSGWAAPQQMALEHGFSFERVMLTGGHAQSARAVADGPAEIAAIDAVTWQMITRFDRWSDGLKVIGKTPQSPALPYITSRPERVPVLYEALEDAIAALSSEDRTALCLHGVTKIPAETYLAVPSPAFPEVSAR